LNTGTGGGILYSTMLVAAVAVIGFSLFGIATMAGYLPNLLSNDNGSESAESAAAASDNVVACANCGVISSMHPVKKVALVRAVGKTDDAAAKKSQSGDGSVAHEEVHYQIRVHMSDGSYRSFDYGVMPQVAVGQPVKVIDGRIVTGD
jgi:hypothetical protein